MSISSQPRLVERRTDPSLSSSARPTEIDAGNFLAALRQALAAGTKSRDTIFREVTEAARILTGASGIALALRTNGAVVCCARSGEIAPEIGSRLDVESGISGQSFRTSTLLRCDDTKIDDRVDPEVCAYFGIRSIAVVPLRGSAGAFGILEAFSSRPYAFSDSQISVLERLVEIAEGAYSRERGERRPEARAARRRFRLRELFRNSTEEALPSEVFDEPSGGNRRRYWLMGASAVLLLLTSAVIWISWYESDDEMVDGDRTAQSTTASDDTAGHPAAALPAKPVEPGPPRFDASISRRAKRATMVTAREIVRPASVAERTPPFSSPEANSASSTGLGGKAETVAPATENGSLASLASGREREPDFAAPPSQGVSDAVLIYQLQPIYPAEARAARVGGSVILETTITEEGAIGDVKAISGPPELIAAAIEAVRHWRYRPALLNGNPTAVEKQVQVTFNAP